MSFEEKKALVLSCTRLGMDLFSSALLAECTEDEVNQLDNDRDFQRRMGIETAIEEKRLLDKHNSAMTLAADRGNAGPIQWKLEKLNPRRWGSKDKDVTPSIGDMTINLIGRFPDGTEC